MKEFAGLGFRNSGAVEGRRGTERVAPTTVVEADGMYGGGQEEGEN